MIPLREKLARILVEQGLTQADLARMSGVSKPYLCRLIAGRRPWSRHVVGLVAAGLGQGREWLLDGTRECAELSAVSEAKAAGVNTLQLSRSLAQALEQVERERIRRAEAERELGRLRLLLKDIMQLAAGEVLE